jgi:hypothetical protein
MTLCWATESRARNILCLRQPDRLTELVRTGPRHTVFEVML